MIWVITGTDTDVGKSVVAAVLAAGLLKHNQRVAIYKPTQTGVTGKEHGDVQQIASWLGDPQPLGVFEGIRLKHPMAPIDAAQEEGGAILAAQLPTLDTHLRHIESLARDYDAVIIEGAGGLLVELTEVGETIADLALACQARVLLVTRPDLGTLNHTALTLEAVTTRGFPAGALVMGSFPARPSAVQLRNRRNLELLARRFHWDWGGYLTSGLGTDATSGERNEALWESGEGLVARLIAKTMRSQLETHQELGAQSTRFGL
ncbi:dethiobiotin synthase [Arthrobacter sp. MYb227]|uniref:dethiobiotin synthase n=1 Tax=Arthrobacter sp. MYb227 TaxID=1848601 RepID=UPI000CFB8F96|nr:dethiobiotin synthase [Arthrobacter sp. MYb227]PQZ93778.1 dethiobiotin synthase [Arthrobacter sp. MYb227]